MNLKFNKYDAFIYGYAFFMAIVGISIPRIIEANTNPCENIQNYCKENRPYSFDSCVKEQFETCNTSGD